MTYCWNCERSVVPEEIAGQMYCPKCGAELEGD